MTFDQALEIIVQLAENNTLSDSQVDGDPQLKEEQADQARALQIVAAYQAGRKAATHAD